MEEFLSREIVPYMARTYLWKFCQEKKGTFMSAKGANTVSS